MAKSSSDRASHTTAADSSKAVEEFMRVLDHPAKDIIQAIRDAILQVDSSITEGIKWHAPSFRTSEYFATTNLREKKGVGVIFHLGAKTRALPPGGITIRDPTKLLKWLAKDRAMLVFANSEDFTTKLSAFANIVKSWISYV